MTPNRTHARRATWLALAAAALAALCGPLTQAALAAPPDTRITSGPGAFTRDNLPTFTFTSTAPGATFRCWLGEPTESFVPCTTPYQPPRPLRDGRHTLHVVSTNAAGETDPTQALYPFTVDTIKPLVFLTGGPRSAQWINDDTPTFDFNSAAEIPSRFGCWGGDLFSDWTFGIVDCTSPFTLPATPNSAHLEFHVLAYDRAGNIGDDSRVFKVDTVEPDTAITSGPPAGGTISITTPTFAFAMSETSVPAGSPSAGFRCALDGVSPAPCASPLTTPTLGFGRHTFTVSAVDAAGNVDSIPAKRSFTVDPALHP